MSAPHGERTVALAPGEAEAILMAAGRWAKPWFRARDQAGIVLLWRCGLRIGELIDLELEDVQLPSRQGGPAQVHIRAGKGGKSRVLALDPRGAEFLMAWVKVRGSEPGPFLISTGKKRRKLTREHWSRLLRKWARQARVPGRVFPHRFRHTFATEFAKQKGVTLRHVQVALGHTSLQTTQVYLEALGADEARSMMARRLW